MPSSVVIQTSFLGDMVLTTPLLSRLAESGPVDVVSTPMAASLLANHPAVRKVITYDKRGIERGPVGFVRLCATLAGEKYDRAFLAQGSVRSGALVMAARISTRVGFDTAAGRAFYTDRARYVDSDHHAARLLSLAGDRGGRSVRPVLYPGDAERAAVDELLRHIDTAAPIFALAPGSVWGTKRWPRFPYLAATLRPLGTVVTVGSAADRELAIPIIEAAGPRAIDATGKLSLLASAELIRRARVIVTNDSSPLHLASAMNTPTVAIFGPTVPAFGFGPLADRSAVVGIDALACRPCDRHGPVSCPLQHWKCMTDASPIDVMAAIDRVTD